jgi:hypothetical protein
MTYTPPNTRPGPVQDTKSWQATYALRAGVEGTIHQAVAVCDIRHARYRGLHKAHLQQVFTAVALNLIRLHAYWNNHPMDHTRTSHLTRLELTSQRDQELTSRVITEGKTHREAIRCLIGELSGARLADRVVIPSVVPGDGPVAVPRRWPV